MENRKERYESFRAEAAGFLAKNGFTLVLGLSLLVIGIAAAATLIPAPAETPEPSPTAAAASQSRDETLQTVTMTPVPAAAPQPIETEAPSPDPAPTAEPAAAASAPKAAVKAAPPVEGEILWGYAVDSLLYSTTLEQWTTHPGVDIGAKAGTEVRAVLGGTVQEVYEDDALGICVRIGHDRGRESLYGNLAENPAVKAGDKVEAGSVIGSVGATAISECMMDSHVHFGFFLDGSAVDPAEHVLLGG